MSEPCSARKLSELGPPSSQVVQQSITARSIIASFNEKLFANPANESVQRLYLIENLLSDSILFRQQHINVILGYFKGIEQGDFSGSRAEMRNIGQVAGATNHMRLQEGGCCGSQEQQLHRQ